MFSFVDVDPGDYSVGDASIDKEHEDLIRVFNFLVINIENGSLASARNVSSELKKHIFIHFQNEESAMAAYNFPDKGYCDNHRFEHDQFRSVISSLLASIEESPDNTELYSELATVVFDLIHNHIMIVDQLMAGFIREYRNS